MHNLVQPKNAGHYNFKTSLAVLGLFAIITIVSYFNELSKAGLLSVKPVASTGEHQHHSRDASMLAIQADDDVSDHDHSANLGFLDLDLGHIHKIIRGNHSESKLASDMPIKISVRLDKNSSYESRSDTGFKLYSYQNSLRNYWTLIEGSDSNGSVVGRQVYETSTVVLLYQHEPTSYLVRDCLLASASQKGLIASSLPINAKSRKDWEQLTFQERDSYQVLYGSLSFGVCEGLTHLCSYLTMLSHPIDRILSIYHLCQLDSSHGFCHFTKMNVTNMTLQEFVYSQGNSLFHKLLYYSQHCRLVDDDEVCLEDSKVSFTLSSAEQEIYLQSIVEHLEDWFSVVGLTQYMELSLQLFDRVHNLNLSACPTRQSSEITDIGDVPYMIARADLLGDPKVQKLLWADLAIYDKLEEIFSRQLKAYKLSLQATTSSWRSLKKKARGKKRHKKKLEHLDSFNHSQRKRKLEIAGDGKREQMPKPDYKHAQKAQKMFNRTATRAAAREKKRQKLFLPNRQLRKD